MNTQAKSWKSAAGFGAALVLLAALSLPGLSQVRPATLTPSVDSAGPGDTFRVDINPVIGLRGREAENLRMVLRPSRAQGPQSDLELRIAEYHGSWFLIRMPQEARPSMGPGRLLLLNPSGDVLASTGNTPFRILAAPRAGQIAPGSGSAAGPAPDKVNPSAGSDPRQGREVGGARQGMTTPGVSGKAGRLPTPVTDYVGIATKEIVLHAADKTAVSVFNLPPDVRLDDQVVLMFLANPDNSETELRISINGHELKRIGFHEGTARTWHVRFNPRGILLPGRNELGLVGYELAVGGVLGSSARKIKVDDIVLWFHRDIQW